MTGSNQLNVEHRDASCDNVASLTFEPSSGRHEIPKIWTAAAALDDQTKSTASEFSRDKVVFPDGGLVSQFAPVASKRHRQTEMATRPRFVDIFPQADFEGLSSDKGFCH